MKLYHAYPKLVNIVGTSYNGKINFMAVAWHTYLSFDPPLYGISIAPKRYTYKLLKESQEFNCNFLNKGNSYRGSCSYRWFNRKYHLQQRIFHGKRASEPPDSYPYTLSWKQHLSKNRKV